MTDEKRPDSGSGAAQPGESADPSPRYEQFNDWWHWTIALAEWVLRQKEMPVGRLAIVFDVVEFQTKKLLQEPGGAAEESRPAPTFATIVEEVKEELYKADMHYHGSFLASFRDGMGMSSGLFDVSAVIAGYIMRERAGASQQGAATGKKE